MDKELMFSLEAVKKIAIFAYETGYCDGIDDKFPKMKDYQNAEDYWIKNKVEYVERFGIVIKDNSNK